MLDLKVHHYVKLPNTTEMRLTKVSPYVRICRAAAPPIFLQEGQVFSEGGEPVTPLPEWFEEELAKITPKVRDEVGWGGEAHPRDSVSVRSVPSAPGRDSAPAVVVKPAATAALTFWTCEDCGAEVPTKKKGFHIAKHRREAKAEGG